MAPLSDRILPGVTSWTEDILKPDLDDRQYRIITLPNKLQALLVHDAQTDKAAAAMDVHVGHLCDDEDVPGLAHFLEHLLFMGTEKYPEENSYSAFLNSHGGHSNAFTSVDSTNYFFDVLADNLAEALDRFSQFFKAPLFDESCTEREMKAVDSEHKKNLQLDAWRLYQLDKTLSSPHHPYHKFGTGSLETLLTVPQSKGVDVRQRLFSFHRKYYSANIMKLVVVGKESLDELTAMVVEQFAAVKNMDISVPAFEGGPLTEEFLLKRILVKPVKDFRQLEITFPFPDELKWFRSRPGSYISHLLGHESEGSILSLLKSLGWANALSAGSSHGSIGWSFFKLNIDLTEEGLQNVDDIVEIVFGYIKVIRDADVQEWVFREEELVMRCAFKFKEKSSEPSSFASRAGAWMQQYPPKEILSGPYLMEEYNPDAIRECLGWLRDDNFRITVTSKESPASTTQASWSNEYYYGTEYKVEALSKSFLERCKHPKLWKELRLPDRNIFIPEDLSVKAGEDRVTRTNSNSEPLRDSTVEFISSEATKKPALVDTEQRVRKRPRLVRNDDLARVWHKKDQVFLVPKVNVYFAVRTPLAYSDPRNAVLTKLFTELVKDSLNEYSYFADVAGLSYYLEAQVEGCLLGFGGYNDKMAVLVEKVAERMRTLKVDPVRFELISEQLSRSYRNFEQESPASHAAYYTSCLIQSKLHTNDIKLEALKSITAQDVQEFYPRLLSRVFVEGLVHGNMYAYESKALAEVFVRTLGSSPVSAEERDSSSLSTILPTPSRLLHQRVVPNPDNLNSAIEYYIQCGDPADEYCRIRLMLVNQMITEPAFDQLRTKEQLGYMVSASIRTGTGVMGLRILIQSERDPVFLESRIEEFLQQFRGKLEATDSDTYEKEQKSIIAKLTETDKNLARESTRHWGHITSRYLDFDVDYRDAAAIRTVTLSDLVEWYKRTILPGSPTARKLSVHMRSQKAEGTGSLPQETVISDIDAWKSTAQLSAPVRPVRPLTSYEEEEV
ncbi:Insulinase (Peptidase M16) [Gonapodya sp. JEL0774]|nr:Insulinase (Peptidase M16) [Gonapodya sp. JEL0774]